MNGRRAMFQKGKGRMDVKSETEQLKCQKYWWDVRLCSFLFYRHANTLITLQPHELVFSTTNILFPFRSQWQIIPKSLFKNCCYPWKQFSPFFHLKRAKNSFIILLNFSTWNEITEKNRPICFYVRYVCGRLCLARRRVDNNSGDGAGAGGGAAPTDPGASVSALLPPHLLQPLWARSRHRLASSAHYCNSATRHIAVAGGGELMRGH